MKLVIAPNYKRFENWCYDNQLSPYDREIRYISGSDKLRGWRNVEVIILDHPNWFTPKDLAYIEMIRARDE
jgi:hypothetical protein